MMFNKLKLMIKIQNVHPYILLHSIKGYMFTTPIFKYLQL